MTAEVKNKHAPKFDPSDPEFLRQLDHDTLVGMYLRLHDQYFQLTEQVRAFIRERYGPTNDTFIDSNQLTLFDAEQHGSELKDGQPGSVESSEAKQSKNRAANRNSKPSNVPHAITKVNQRRPEDLVCACCGKSLRCIGQILRHSRFDYKPASARVEDFVEDVFACDDCDAAVVSAAELTGTLLQAKSNDQDDAVNAALASELMRWIGASPSSTEPQESNKLILDDAVAIARSGMLRSVAQIARCKASAGMISYVAVSKYCDHLPLYRLEEILARQGVYLNRSTMCGWLVALSALLRPLYELMRTKLLESKVIWTDDTPVKVQVRRLKKNIKTGRIWVYIGDKNHPFNLFHYTSGRAREGPKRFLRGYSRYLQGDCFSGNEAICAENGATLVACNAHARRYFVKALLNYKAKSEEALRFFQQLFEIEKTAKELDLDADETKLMREQEAMPILDELKRWLDKEHLVALPKSAFGKAVSYCLNNWDALKAYLQDGDLTIENNVAEREMKTVAIGRKAWLFFGSDNGGENAEVIMSIISTCKRHKVEPWAYLREVIDTLILNPDTDLEQLLPHTWNSRTAKPELAA